MLEPYRVLDLTDVRGQIAGMLLGDLGADVIRVEPPEGSEARRAGPFLEDAPEPERSLSFAAYNRNKRSIALALPEADALARFRILVEGADFLIDSGPDGWLDRAGIEAGTLLAWNPTLIHVRITPFGSDGPNAALPAADLTIAALGGPVSLQGDPDREPVRLSVPQAWRHAGAEAAVAALIGHARMRTSGRGVTIDVSAQSALSWTMLNGALAHAIQGHDFERAGSTLQLGGMSMELVHPCGDGHVVMMPRGEALLRLRDWLLEDGVVDEDWLAQEDWSTWDARRTRGEPIDVPPATVLETFRRWLAKHDKTTLLMRGLALGVTIAPVQTLDDLLSFPQLVARDYFVETPLPDGSRASAPGAFAKCSGGPLARRRIAPRLDEHGDEIDAELAAGPRARITVDEAPRALPLEGLKVADFSWVGVGPISGKYLADHGADVIRIESQGRADVLRAAGPFIDGKPGWNRSQFFGDFNTSKRSLELDLKHPRAREVTDRLLDWADVVLEAFTPGAVDRIGIGYEHARARNPGIVMVSTCLMGQTGPICQMAGYGYHAAAVAGFYEVTGYADRAPSGPWNAYTDTIAPRFLTTTLLAALDHRRRTGEGQHIDLAQMEASLHFLAPELLARQATGESFSRDANRSRGAAPQGCYPCAGDDEWCAVAIESDEQWRALAAAIGREDWAEDPGLAHASGRIEAQPALDEGLAAWTRSRPGDEIVRRLGEAGVPAGRVQRSRDLLEDPQLRHRGFHRWFEHAEMGRVPYSGHQFRISGYEHGPRGPAPLLGEHSFEVLTETLGFDPEAVAGLMGDGAVG